MKKKNVNSLHPIVENLNKIVVDKHLSKSAFADLIGFTESKWNKISNGEQKLQLDELSKIAKIVEQVEKSAIDRYIKKAAHEQSLEKSNTEAKQRLQANAQKSKSDGKNLQPFTREQIGKMTSAEFLKHESLIMDQLKKGLIK